MALTALRLRNELNKLSPMEAMDTKVLMIIGDQELFLDMIVIEYPMDQGFGVRLRLKGIKGKVE